LSAVAEDSQRPWFGLICLFAYFIMRALGTIPNVSSFLLYTSPDIKYSLSLSEMVTLMGCFQFTAEMGSVEFSNQETEYKLRRGMSASNRWFAAIPERFK